MAITRPPRSRRDSPHVVIVGGGFGGAAAAKGLGRAGIATTIVDRRNHHLFQPLLYQVATAALSPADIAEPIRKLVRRYPSVNVRLAEVNGIDDHRCFFSDGGSIAFDYLILATGAEYTYFGNPQWAARAPGLKSVADARTIRRRLLLAFERAEAEDDPCERARLLTAVVVGGGPTGVELAGAMAELARYALAKDFRNIRPEEMSVVLAEAGPRLLPSFSERSASYAERRLRRLGVTVRLRAPVKELDDHTVTIGDERLGAATVAWAAGVEAAPAAGWLDAATDRAGRIVVNRDLSVPSRPNVFALGDVTALAGDDGNPLPGLAQVAKQQGRHLGRSLSRLIVEGVPPAPFHYRSRGNAAIIGRHAAIYEAGRVRLRGPVAWLMWAIVHIYLLSGAEHRLLVAMQWLWRYLTYERGARLIAGRDEDEATNAAATGRATASDTDAR